MPNAQLVPLVHVEKPPGPRGPDLIAELDDLVSGRVTARPVGAEVEDDATY